MLVRGVEDIHVVREQAALLRVAMLVARDEPLEALYGAVSEEVATLLGADAGAVMRFIGSERAVIVGVHRCGGVRGLPVNAEIDVDTSNSALGRAQRTLLPARATYPVADQAAFAHLMRTVGLKCSVAAPVLLHGEAWGALIVSATEEELLPPGSEQRLVGLAGLMAQALVNADARAELAASRRRLVEAGDELRRRLERELHEGAQQHVVALALKLRVACGRSLPGSEEEKLLADVLVDAMEASAELSEMARGLHPAVLSERGLAAALQALVARSAAAGAPARAARPALRARGRDDGVRDGGRGDRQRHPPRARHRVHAARRRRGRPADRRAARQRHRRRRRPRRRRAGGHQRPRRGDRRALLPGVPARGRHDRAGRDPR